MGISASADLAFGIDCGEASPLYRELDEYGYPENEDEGEDFDGGDLGEYLAERAGLVNPYDKLPHEVNHGTSEDYANWKKDNPWFEAATDEWYEAKRKLEKDAPVEIDYYGASVYDYTAYTLVLKDKNLKRSIYGGCEEISSLPLQPSEEAIQEAKDFCDKNGLRAFDNPQWLLYTNMG